MRHQTATIRSPDSRTRPTVDLIPRNITSSDPPFNPKPKPNPNPNPNPMASSGDGAAAAEATSRSPNPKRGRRGAAEKVWTEAEEMAILEGFLEFVTERGTPRAPYKHDAAPFFDRIRPRLRRADLNRAQLAEKLRRLKRKYRAAASRLAAAPSAAFRTPHDRATFELARKIWSPSLTTATSAAAAAAPEPEEGRKGMEEKWREQQILELEVLLKRAELLHEHFSAKLDEMRSTTTTTTT